MKISCWVVVLLGAALLGGAGLASTEPTPTVSDLLGTWQLESSKSLTTGLATQSANLSWIQFTKSHWTVLVMEPNRKVIAPDEFEKLSADEKMRTNYARVWSAEKGQVFQARGGTYRLAGNKIYHTAAIALLAEIIGIERVLKIMKFDQTTLVVETEFPDAPDLRVELTYRRLD